MTQALRDAIDRYARTHADAAGIAGTPVRGMSLVRSISAGELRHAIDRPLICLVVQGTKQVTTRSQSLAFRAGDCMLLTADAVTVSQITQASPSTPYLSFALNLDAAIIAELSAEMNAVASEGGPALRLQPTDAEVADTALRLVNLLDRPAAMPVLQAQIVRELHYWLLAGDQGPAMRHMGLPDSRSRRIARAVEIVRTDFAAPLSVAQLASAAGMSTSTFHHHFRAVTSLSPLQFQKQLRLIEARRLMLAKGLKPSVAAHKVGYESVSQFTREYRRLFGQPPARETRQAQRALRSA
ncbi:AraC family transcriptional regulator N-terminal domain-containing protein [Phenylobacterium sp.]|uniref:AraC family transcriptional regulator n=1 Tax=Phenylobacterium sp. TaxID=1871053 RepID=UPI0035AF7D15